MTTFQIHSIKSAPEGSKPILDDVQNEMGFLPNLMGTLGDYHQERRRVAAETTGFGIDRNAHLSLYSQ